MVPSSRLGAHRLRRAVATSRSWPGLPGALLVGLVVAGFVLPRPLPGGPLFIAGLLGSVLSIPLSIARMGGGRRLPWALILAGTAGLCVVVMPWALGSAGAAQAASSPLTAIASLGLVLGALQLIKPDSPDRDPVIFIDAGVLAIAFGMITWCVLVLPHLEALGDGTAWLDAALATAYPSLDIALLGVAGYSLWSQRGMTAAQWLLTGGLIANSITDFGVFHGFTFIGHTPGQLSDLGMALLVPFAAAAALQPSAGRPLGLHRRIRDQRVLGVRLIAVAASMFLPPLVLVAYLVRRRLAGPLVPPPGMPSVEEQVAVMMLVFVALGSLRLILTVVRMEGVLRTRDGLEVELKRQALVDGLTTLPNRRAFSARLANTLGQGNGPTTAVLFCDLDDFKVVNDTLGHHVGDELLTAVANRLTASVRPSDMAARLGGDEFAVLLGGVAGPDAAELVAQRILAAFAEPMSLTAALVPVRVSIGIAMAEDGQSADELMRDADIAMYLAKGGGKGRVERFDPAMRSRVAERMALQQDLSMAVLRDELFVAYQPISSLASETIIGAEALLRWRHPVRGVVPPNDFIPLAEQSGLIHEIGRWVLQTACRDMRGWLDAGAAPETHVSVNVSPVQLIREGFADEVVGIVAAARLSPAHVMLEITESALVDAEAAGAALGLLKRHGFRIAIDDFGTGYSAMSYLASFPIDVLKIDRAFVSRMSEDEQGRSLVKTILGLARNLDLETIAEGIEDRGQLRELERLGCRFGQGWLLGRPLESATVNGMLAAASRRGKGRSPVTAAAPAA